MTHKILSHGAIALPFAVVRDWAKTSPYYEDHGRVEPDGSLVLAFGAGEVGMTPDGAETRLWIGAQDAAGAQVLRDFINQTAAEAGVAIRWRERFTPGRPVNLSLGRVTAIRRISPAFRRVEVEGPDIARLLGGGLHFRLLMGPKGARWPTIDTAGLTQWDGGIGAWHRPVYTIRTILETGGIGFDIFLHEGGRVSQWSEALHIGDEVALMGPSGGDIPADPGWIGLFGDETALPVLARILAALPAGARGQADILVPEAADIQPLPHPAGVRLNWLLRSDGGDLLAALADMTPPGAGRFVFFAAGKTETTAARRILEGRGFGKKEFWAMAYWQ